MNRQGAFGFSAIAAIALALLPSHLGAQQGTLRQLLVGAWTIVSYQGTDPNGKTRELTNPKGLLIFDAAGRYAQVIARDDRPKFKSPSEPTAEELAAATADFFTADAGTWTVSEGERLLIQEFDAALRPDNDGAIFRSGISLSGDELRLVSVRPLPSGERIDVLYRRAK
jgi:hypothetical protein